MDGVGFWRDACLFEDTCGALVDLAVSNQNSKGEDIDQTYAGVIDQMVEHDRDFGMDLKELQSKARACERKRAEAQQRKQGPARKTRSKKAKAHDESHATGAADEGADVAEARPCEA